MSDFMENKPDEDCCRSERIHVVIRSVTESLDLSTGGDWTIRQLKWTLSERLGGSADQLVLIQNGRILRDSELMSHLKGENGSVSLCVIQRAQSASTQPACDPASESQLTAVSEPEQRLTPTSPLYLVEGLDSLDLENGDPGFFLSLQREMEGQLLCNPEMMQNTLCTSSPQLIRQLTLSNPQIQQLLQTNPEVEGTLNNKDVINKVLGLIRNPDVIDGLVLEDNPSTTTAASGVLQKTEAKKPQSSLKTPQRTASSVNQPEESLLAPVLSCDSTEPLRGLIAASSSQRTITAGMRSVLEEITAHPGLMESLMSGPHASCVLNCLSQNPDLAAQMLLSHPMFSGNVQLQQQMRQQIPVFLQQMQSPEVLSAMLNPRVMEALLQIQQGLQILAAEAPSLIPLAELGTGGVNAASDAGPSSQSGCSDQVATVTEQQQQFVREMLEALANTNNQLCQEEAELQGELENPTGFRDRRTNL